VELPEAVFSRSRWRRLAWEHNHFPVQSGRSLIFPDLPLPRRGVLSGKSPRTSRRWRLFFVRFQPLCAEKDAPPFHTPTAHNTGCFRLPVGPMLCPVHERRWLSLW